MNIINIINDISKIYPVSKQIYAIIGTILSIFTLYNFKKYIYILIGLFKTRKFKESTNYHKYAICIAARNEEKVIGNLIDSIHKQDYPKDKLTIFVVADNCTDHTKEVCLKKNCIVYERFDNEHKTKGYALQYLFKNIEKDYKTDSFEGYFIFDADNLLKSDYVKRMNDAFDEGCKIITSYRNTKNFDENYLASTFALHWIRSIRQNHRARSVLRLATNIQGTGFLFSNEIVKDGWNYTSLTEDRALTADAVSQGYQITYQDRAMFYDEQPTKMSVVWRQRIRWRKGHLQAFVETGPKLFLNIFFGKKFVKTDWNKEKKKLSKKERFIESIRHRFASFDTLGQLIPAALIAFIKWFIVPLLLFSFFCYSNGLDKNILSNSNYLSKLLIIIFGNKHIVVPPSIEALFISLFLTILARLIFRISEYFKNVLVGAFLFIIERKNIKKMPLSKKILYSFTWPLFDIISRYATIVALFTKVEWKPIPHDSKITIDDLNK